MDKTKVHHVAINVPNINQALAIFKDVLGMEITSLEGDVKNPSQVWLLGGGIQLIASREQALSIGHIGIIGDSQTEIISDLLAAGYQQLSKGPNWLMAPDGLVLEVMKEI